MILDDNGGRKQGYALPLEIVHSTPRWQLILICVLGPFLIAVPFLVSPEALDMRSVLLQVLVFYGILPLTGLVLTFVVAPSILWKKTRYYIENDGVRMRALFGEKEILWSDIEDVTTVSINGNEFIGFVTRRRIQKANNGGFLAALMSGLGGVYEVSIPLKKMGGLNPERVMLTIKEAFAKELKGRTKRDFADVVEEVEEEFISNSATPTNYGKAGLYSFLAASIIGLGYFVSIVLFGVNFVIFPIIGVVVAAFVFGKHVRQTDYNHLCRIYVSLLGAYSVFAVRIGLAFSDGSTSLTLTNLLNISYAYFFLYLPENLSREFTWVILALVAMGTGYTMGPSLSIFQTAKSMFLRKLGRIPYEKKGAYYRLYLTPPEQFDENQDKYSIVIAKGCEIELNGKTPTYFKIPLAILKETGVNWPSDLFSISLDGKYLELDLGGVGNTQEYVYDTIITIGSNKSIETIGIETH